MELNEMKVGVFGIRPEFIEKLKTVFADVEVVTLYRDKPYDLLFFDISYASKRVFQFIARRFPVPLVFSSFYNDFDEKLKFLPKNSYITWDIQEDFDRCDFELKLNLYLSIFMLDAACLKINPELVPRDTNPEQNNFFKTTKPIEEIQVRGDHVTLEEVWKAWISRRLGTSLQ